MPSAAARQRNRQTLVNSANAMPSSRTIWQPLRRQRTTLFFLITISLLLYQAWRFYSSGAYLALSSKSSSDSVPGLALVPGNDVVDHPLPQSSEPSASESLPSLNELDMDTVQAMFDALYGDGGPLDGRRD